MAAEPTVSLTTAQTVVASLVELDLNGNPVSPVVAPAQPPVWASDNPTVATVAAAADGMSAVITPATPPTPGVTNISAVATIGGTKMQATGVATVTGVTAAVASITLSFAPPTP